MINTFKDMQQNWPWILFGEKKPAHGQMIIVRNTTTFTLFGHYCQWDAERICLVNADGSTSRHWDLDTEFYWLDDGCVLIQPIIKRKYSKI